MRHEVLWQDKNLIEVLKSGGVAVMPTDTIYGIVGSALNKETVERIYDLRNRSPVKPCIILVGGVEELEKFSVTLSPEQRKFFTNYPPESTSIILDCPDEKFSYLHRGSQTLAFRLPSPPALRELLIGTGPLITPSANIEGENPARNITEAKKYFGEGVDFYLDGGEIEGNPSRVVKLQVDGTVSILRQ